MRPGEIALLFFGALAALVIFAVALALGWMAKYGDRKADRAMGSGSAHENGIRPRRK